MYAEGMPGPCRADNAGNHAVRHYPSPARPPTRVHLRQPLHALFPAAPVEKASGLQSLTGNERRAAD